MRLRRPTRMCRRPVLRALCVGGPMLALAGCSGSPHTATSTARLPLTGGGAGASPAAAARATGAPTPGAPTTVIVFLTAPAHPGRPATLTADTAPRAVCKVTVSYTGTTLHPTALPAHDASATGTVTWQWTLGSQTPLGDWGLVVACTPGGQAATVLAVR